MIIHEDRLLKAQRPMKMCKHITWISGTFSVGTGIGMYQQKLEY
jgi:hypothetical protein